jgi:hypothetical protein
MIDLIGWVISLIIIISFFALIGYVRKILRYIQALYYFEKTRMISQKLLDPESDKIIEWMFDDYDHPVRRNKQ